MSVNIKMNGVTISGNAKVLNNAKINSSDINFNMEESSVGGNSEVLNNLTAKESQINVEIENTDFDKEVQVLNNVTTDNGKIDVELSNSQFKEEARFMNDRSFQGKVTYETVRTGTGTQKAGNVEEVIESVQFHHNTSKKAKEGTIKKILKKLFGKKDSSFDTIEETSEYGIDKKTAHERFEKEISGNGAYREMSTEEIINRVLNSSSRTNENNKDRNR